MASSVIRTRIALLALVGALVFVVVGFLRADREMTQVERDRATLVASETSTLVEVFLLRQLFKLHDIARAIDDGSRTTTAGQPNAAARLSSLEVPFDELWLATADSQGHRSVTLLRGHSKNSTDSVQVAALVKLPTMSPAVIAGGFQSGAHSILFVELLQRSPSRQVIGITSPESLAVLLQRRKQPNSVGVVVMASSDTIVKLIPQLPNESRRSLRLSVETPTVDGWTVTISYIPTGRGARIALWIVGLGAIIGLGIGLLLERREASRIADRSSELEHLSTELLRANRAKSEFLANVSHELRTPLNAIVGFVDLLRDGVYGPLNSRQSGPVERIEASANHLRHLVDQVLDLAKMAAGRLEVHAEPLELRPFVFDVASEVEPLMTEKGLSLSLAVGASLPRIRTDPTHLRQILINLLGNAVKFTNDGGISIRGKLVNGNSQVSNVGTRLAVSDLITSAVRPETSWIALQVADSGIGIPEKDCKRIFDEFEQVNAGPRGDSMRRGTGLGLSISRRLARLLGGDITVESELGRGSIFTVWLPVDPADLRGNESV